MRALVASDAGTVSPSLYETARVVSDAPWLSGHDERLRYLLSAQEPDGAWGPHVGYALVPTLSATEALLRVTAAPSPADPPDIPGLLPATDRALRALVDRLLTAPAPVPDTPAVDLIVPALVDRINALLAAVTGRVGPSRWHGLHPLSLPNGLSRRRAHAVGALVASGRPLPEKLMHAAEVLDVPPVPHQVRPVAGAVGASPAATAAWLGRGAAGREPAALAYLETAVRRQGGPVPCTTPIRVFERSWVLANLARAGTVPVVPEGLLDDLAGAVGATGAATSPGLPTDADTTSVVLYALARLGRPLAPDSLFHYDTGTHFCTWRGEDGASVTTNAHVLEAFGWHGRDAGEPRYVTVVRRVSAWLVECQQADGSWTDRWHASPYYATASAALGLGEYAPDLAATAVDRAVDWVVDTQRPDGSWGWWHGTAEETAYALQVLLGTGRQGRRGVPDAVTRALAFLDAGGDVDTGTPLWHDKDLYCPLLIVRSAVLAARHLAHRHGGGTP